MVLGKEEEERRRKQTDDGAEGDEAIRSQRCGQGGGRRRSAVGGLEFP